MFRAILCEDVDSIATFLKQGADINAKLIDDCWNSPLHKAAEGNKLHSLVLLLKNGADISPFSIHFATRKKKRKGKDWRGRGETV
jgi:hypothetical protein